MYVINIVDIKDNCGNNVFKNISLFVKSIPFPIAQKKSPLGI